MSELFFSKKLTDKMKHIKKAGFTILEAPAGYGKTTLVSEALKEMPGVYWYIALKTVKKGSWQWFLDRMEMMDCECADKLRMLGEITQDNAYEASDIIMQAKVKEDTYIVFDNFQYIAQEWQTQVIATFARRKPDGLHVICISQYMGELHRTQQGLNKSLCVVLEEDLLLDREEIQGLARKKGIEMTPTGLATAYEKTDGWAVAVAVYLRNRKKYGERIFAMNETNELLYDLFWKQLTQKEQRILMRLCPFEEIGLKYIFELLPDNDTEPEEIKALFSRVPLLKYKEAQQLYAAHELLISFLRFQLVIGDEQFHHEVCMRAGEVYRRGKRMAKAVECFYKAKAYEEILSCNLAGMLMESFDGETFQNMAKTILEHCPPEIQRKYPVSVLRLCYGLFAGTEFEEFEKYMKRSKQVLDVEHDRQIMGEWLMVFALSEFPDVMKMCHVYREAGKYLKQPSEVFCREEPFMFGCTSMFYLFYSKQGRMMKIADELDEMMAVYNSLTNDHGAGAAELYRAEAVEVQGDFVESEILAHKAQLMAEKAGNVSIIYAVAQLCGINALYQSDVETAGRAVEYLDRQAHTFAGKYNTQMLKCMEETVRSYILALMMETAHSAEWTQGEADTLTDLSFTNFMAKLSRTTDLILKKEYRYAIAGIEASLQLDSRMLSVPARSMMYVGLMMCCLAIGRMTEAADYFAKILEMVKEDKNYVFVSCYRNYFGMFTKIPELISRYGKVIKEIEGIDVKYIGEEKIKVIEILGRSEADAEALTRREREIAQLAAKGYRNSEIAQTLHITENTVKGYMKDIFRKLGIDRRNYLAEALERYSI